MDMCRVCLSTEKEMLNLDENFVINYNILTNLDITLLDGLPQKTCNTCFDAVKYFMEFRDKCIASETALRDIVATNVLKEGIKSENYTEAELPANIIDDKPIKTEIKQECEDSTFSDNYDVYNGFGDDEFKDFLFKRDENDIKPRGVRRKQNKRKKKIKIEKSLAIDKLIDSTKKLVCGLCEEEFEDGNSLNSHLETHKSEQACRLCKETCSNWPALLAHRVIHVPIGQHKCNICDKRYKSPVYLEHHLRNTHIQEAGKRMHCKYCSLAFARPKRLVRHIQEKHFEQKYYCDICSKGFNNKTNLTSHLKRHSNKKTYVCDLCGFSCKHSGGLKDHTIRKHAPTKTYCKNCARVFVNQAAHDRHRCKPKVPNLCPICGKEVSGHNRLSRHLQTHSDHREYQCTRCPAKYKSSTALLAHLHRHDNNRTKQCEFCNAKFFTTSVLIKHRRIHTGEKPYVCKVCNKGFTGNNNLKVHMKVHGEYLIVKKNSEPDDPTKVTK